MTFEQFIATRKWSDNLAVDCEAYNDEGLQVDHVQSGYIYDGCLVIEATEDWWPEGARAEGKWHLLIERSEYMTDDLDALERRLYRWAVSAGFADTMVDAMARLHVAILKEWMTVAHWEEMQRRNAQPDRGEGVCHSHDFCDANMAMADAFEQATGRESNVGSEEDCALWNAAWNWAMPELSADPQSRRGRIAGGTP